MAGITLSLPLKVALPCLVVGVVFFLVSFSVNHWVTLSLQNAKLSCGLWKVCGDYRGYSKCTTWTDDNLKSIQRDWLHKTQALQCLALVVLIGMVGSLVVFAMTRLKAAIVTSIVTALMAAFFMLLGCILFAIDVNDDSVYSAYGKLDWAFGFSIVAAIFIAAAGGSLIMYVLCATTTITSGTTTSDKKLSTIS